MAGLLCFVGFCVRRGLYRRLCLLWGRRLTRGLPVGGFLPLLFQGQGLRLLCLSRGEGVV